MFFCPGAPPNSGDTGLFEQRNVGRELRNLAAGKTDDQVAAVPGQRAQGLLRQVAAYRVENDVHALAANLPDGRILTWSGSERETWPTDEQTYSATWDPETGEFVEVLHEGHNMFCAHLALTENGEVFVTGGTEYYKKVEVRKVWSPAATLPQAPAADLPSQPILPGP